MLPTDTVFATNPVIQANQCIPGDMDLRSNLSRKPNVASGCQTF